MEMKMGVAITVILILMTRSSAQSADGPSFADDPLAPFVDGPSSKSCETSITDTCHNVNATQKRLLKTCCGMLGDAHLYDNTGCFCAIILSSANFEPLCNVYFNNAQCGRPGPPSRDNSSTSESSGSKLAIIIGVTAAGVFVVVSLIIGVVCICKRKSKQDVENYKPSPAPAPTQAGSNKYNFLTPESLQFKLKDLQKATSNFSKDNKIGRGGFGIVYKGILSNGKQIAVKRLLHRSSQGVSEFETEVVLLAKLKHRNLVKLLGFCLANEEALLVYEFVPNKSLDHFLFDSNKRPELNWSCRFEIIKGVARGMLYLHEDSPVNIMHRDLKAANVLLDHEMQSKIADFGLARICDVGQTHINPTRVVGTHGYMAPEYLFHGQFSAKSDVYSMGVLMLEIVSGQRVNGTSFTQPGGGGLLIFVWRCWEDKEPLEILDPLLRDSFSRDEFIKCVKLGLLCVQEDKKLRPTMSTIVHILNSDSNSGAVALPMPQPPAFINSGNPQESTSISNSPDSTTPLY